MMRRFAPLLLLLIALCSQRTAAQAGCTLTVTTLSFGTYTGAVLNGTATGKVTCTGGWDVPMYTGTGAGATETIRYMTGPNGAKLSYKLFTDAARTNNWGDTTGNEDTGTGNANFTVYGQVAATQVVAPGTYTDTMSTATTTFTVTAVITATCTISANGLGFGTYAGTLINATATVTVNCTNLAPFNIGLNAGTGSGATVTTRKMTGPGAATLGYSLFRDTGRTLNWGNTVGTDTLSATGTGSAVQYTVYGRIPAGTVPVPGTYNDTIIATVTY
jgi:spore coat protein U-like protein